MTVGRATGTWKHRSVRPTLPSAGATGSCGRRVASCRRRHLTILIDQALTAFADSPLPLLEKLCPLDDPAHGAVGEHGNFAVAVVDNDDGQLACDECRCGLALGHAHDVAEAVAHRPHGVGHGTLTICTPSSPWSSRAVAESVGSPCRVHDLRYTRAAWLIADGEHPMAIQARLGHSSTTATMDRYGHLMDGVDDEIAAHLDTRAAAAATSPPTDLPTHQKPLPSMLPSMQKTPQSGGFLPTCLPEAGTRSPDRI